MKQDIIKKVNKYCLATLSKAIQNSPSFTDLLIYSRVQKSIENWSECSKMVQGEVGVSLP